MQPIKGRTQRFDKGSKFLLYIKQIYKKKLLASKFPFFFSNEPTIGGVLVVLSLGTMIFFPNKMFRYKLRSYPNSRTRLLDVVSSFNERECLILVTYKKREVY